MQLRLTGTLNLKRSCKMRKTIFSVAVCALLAGASIGFAHAQAGGGAGGGAGGAGGAGAGAGAGAGGAGVGEPGPWDRLAARAAWAAALAVAVPGPDPVGPPAAARAAPRHFVPAGATIPPVADIHASCPDKKRRLPSPARQLLSYDGVLPGQL